LEDAVYAIVEAGGKQHRVEEGTELTVNRMLGEAGESIELGRVLLVSSGDDDLKVGTPTVEGAVVKATILEHARDKKVIIFRYKNKNRYRVKKGHRQPITRLRVDAITL
jgi:large subunit ribosomal protein L21